VGSKAEEKPKFVRVDEVAELLDVSQSHAYKIMRELNTELKRKGKITNAGRVSRRYLEERLYC
jgi:Mn-dependent DtxR family transcriptional regulator